MPNLCSSSLLRVLVMEFSSTNIRYYNLYLIYFEVFLFMFIITNYGLGK